MSKQNHAAADLENFIFATMFCNKAFTSVLKNTLLLAHHFIN
ncbi:hypothetical protein [Marinomonas epiphytica]